MDTVCLVSLHVYSVPWRATYIWVVNISWVDPVAVVDAAELSSDEMSRDDEGMIVFDDEDIIAVPVVVPDVGVMGFESAVTVVSVLVIALVDGMVTNTLLGDTVPGTQLGVVDADMALLVAE